MDIWLGMGWENSTLVNDSYVFAVRLADLRSDFSRRSIIFIGKALTIASIR